MAPRGRAATKAAEPEVEEAEGAPDLTIYLEKTITDKMQDYVTFVIDEVFGGDQKEFDNCPADRLLYLGPTVYHFFQASDFNKEQTAKRRAAKAAGNGEAEGEAEEAPAKPSRGRKPAAKPAAAAPAKPATRGRGRTKPAGKPSETEAAPY